VSTRVHTSTTRAPLQSTQDVHKRAQPQCTHTRSNQGRAPLAVTMAHSPWARHCDGQPSSQPRRCACSLSSGWNQAKTRPKLSPRTTLPTPHSRPMHLPHSHTHRHTLHPLLAMTIVCLDDFHIRLATPSASSNPNVTFQSKPTSVSTTTSAGPDTDDLHPSWFVGKTPRAVVSGWPAPWIHTVTSLPPSRADVPTAWCQGQATHSRQVVERQLNERAAGARARAYATHTHTHTHHTHTQPHSLAFVHRWSTRL
jgi:hypothetical protein